MLMKDCEKCKYKLHMVALGFGVRCNHEDNQKYKKENERLKNLPIIITHIPENCPYKEVR